MRTNRCQIFVIASLLMLAALLFSACGPGITQSELSEDENMTLYLPLDSYDQIRDRALYAGVSTRSFAPGLVDSAYWMGDNSLLSFPARSVIHPEHGTIEFWVCPKSRWNDGRFKTLVSLGGEGAFSLSISPNLDDLRLTLHGESVGIAPDDSATDEQVRYQWRAGWTHIAAIWQHLGSGEHGELKILIDGKVVGRKTGKFPRIDTSDPMIIGAVKDGTAPYALIDELRVFNYAREESEYGNVTGQFEQEHTEKIQIFPTPHRPGLLNDPGFVIDADTLVVVSPEQELYLTNALDVLNDAVDQVYGFRLEIVTDRSGASGNVIAAGIAEENTALARLVSTRKIHADGTNPGPGGYVLEISSDGVAIAGSDFSGVIKGILSMTQIIRQFNDFDIPPLLLIDYPDMAFRATVITGDVNFDEELKGRIRFFAALGLSHLLFENDMYYFLDQADYAERLSEIFSYCRSLGVEPVPLINLWSKSAPIIELCADDGVDCAEAGSETIYCPCEPYTYTVVERVIESVISRLKPVAIHIGHDDITAINKDYRCLAFDLSPAELFFRDLSIIKNIVEEAGSTAEIMAWWDMLSPWQNRWRLELPSPSGELPPDIDAKAPRDIVWCAGGYYGQDPLWQQLMPFVTMGYMSDLQWGDYLAGPVSDDMSGAYHWIRYGMAFGAKGFLHRSNTAEPLSDSHWDALPVAAEYAWSYYVPYTPEYSEIAFWYDFTDILRSYGGFYDE